VDVIVAISTERDQIFFCVVTQEASRAHVVDLETIGTPAVLASPAVTLQHFGVELAISILGSAEVSVVAVGNHSLDFPHLLHEFCFLWIWKQGIESTECEQQRIRITTIEVSSGKEIGTNHL